MTNNLLPCPFCGSEPTVEFPQDGYPEILCRNCYQAGTTLAQSTVAEAIAAWNTRTERTCHMEYNAAASDIELYPTEAYICSLCGWETLEGKPTYCSCCGAKVVN